MELLSDLRAAVTVIAFVTFLCIVFWAWSGQRKQAFDEAANLPFMDAEDRPIGSDRKRSGR